MRRALTVAVLAASLNIGCATESEPPPPAHEMPSDWEVVADIEAPPNQIEELERTLGGKISALRRTDYDVEGSLVRINILVAPDAENADKLWGTLRTMKSDRALLRKGRVMYEFVGANSSLPLIELAKERIDSAT